MRQRCVGVSRFRLHALPIASVALRRTWPFPGNTFAEVCLPAALQLSARRRESDGQRRQRRDDGAGYRWLLGANWALQKTWQRLWQVDAVLFCQRQQARRRRQQRRRQCAKTEETETTPTN